MKVRDTMTTDVTIASPRQAIWEAARLMAECDSGVLPVGENDRLVGMITDRDIAVRAVAERLSPDTPVRDVMSAEVLYCFEDEDVVKRSDAGAIASLEPGEEVTIMMPRSVPVPKTFRLIEKDVFTPRRRDFWDAINNQIAYRFDTEFVRSLRDVLGRLEPSPVGTGRQCFGS